MKKLAKHIHNGQKLKFHRPAKLYIAKDGSYVETQKDSEEIPIQSNPDGSKYIEIEDEDGYTTKFYLSWLVASIFLKKSNDGNPYVVIYKDGNPGNCNYENLEWGLGIENPAITDEVQLDSNMFVRKDGTVFVDNTQLRTTDHIYDPDPALWSCFGEPRLIFYPTGDSYPKFLNTNTIMENAGFVKQEKIATVGNTNGDLSKENDKFGTLPQASVNTAIIHIDGDVCNFESSNLLSVPLSDQRYIDYQKLIADYKHKRNVELNPGKELPSGW